MKKILALVLAALLVLGLAACAPAAPQASEAPATQAPAATEAPAATAAPADDNLTKSLALDAAAAQIKGDDGQIMLVEGFQKPVKERPADPAALPDDDAGKYYDMEYAGWNAGEKVNPPTAGKGTGSIGKHIIVIVHGDHPWTTAYGNGAKKIAEAYGMTIDIWSPNWDINVQNQLIDQAINAQPDGIVLIPMDAKSAIQQFKKINESGIPLIGSNCLPEAEAMKYIITWTGPDDWGQMRMLANQVSKDLGGKGGIAYITHNPGGSPYFARMFGPITELKQIAPDIKTLAFDSPGFDAVKCKQLVTDWLTKYGKDLNAIFCADDSAQAIGAIDALKEAGRTDVLVYAAGNSKVGMDYVASGDLKAINYQTANGDGAFAVKAIADWFNGKDIAPIQYLPQALITKENVSQFQPAQW